MEVETAKAVMTLYPGIVGKVDLDISEWAKILFRRMCYTKMKGTTAKSEMPADLRKEAEFLFYHQIVEEVKANQIPDSLTLNFDQTPLKYVPV